MREGSPVGRKKKRLKFGCTSSSYQCRASCFSFFLAVIAVPLSHAHSSHYQREKGPVSGADDATSATSLAVMPGPRDFGLQDRNVALRAGHNHWKQPLTPRI